MSNRLVVFASMTIWSGLFVGYAEDAVPPAPVPPSPSNWNWNGRLGGFLGSVTTGNGDTSRDPIISGTQSSTSWLTTLDAGLGWKSDLDSADNEIKARYGRICIEGGDWSENNDKIRYDGVYRREVMKPTFVYLSWGAQSVFTGPAPDENAFDPTLGKVGGGFGQRFEDFLPDRNKLEWRLGARAQKYWAEVLPREVMASRPALKLICATITT